MKRPDLSGVIEKPRPKSRDEEQGPPPNEKSQSLYSPLSAKNRLTYT